MPNFISQMLSDEHGIPDEANVVFVGAAVVLTLGAVAVAFGGKFPLADYAMAICTLIPLYRASRGDWRGEKPIPPQPEKD